MVCKDVVTEPVLQDVKGEQLTRESNKLDINARSLCETQRSPSFDVRVCHPNAESFRELEPQQIYCLHQNEKKRQNRYRTWHIHTSDLHNNGLNEERSA